MNSRLHPIFWLLCGFITCLVLLCGILWWRGGGNPFANPREIAAAPAPVAVPAPAGPVSPEAAEPPAASPAASTTLVEEKVPKTAASGKVAALTSLAQKAKAGTGPQQELIDAAYQWGVLHLPADLTTPDAPFEEVMSLLKTSPVPHERGMAALALAGSGRSSEAMEAILKVQSSLKPDAPERFLVEEAVKLANEVPGDILPGGKKEEDRLKTAPPAKSSTAAAGNSKKSDDGAPEIIRSAGGGATEAPVGRPALPHETAAKSPLKAKSTRVEPSDAEPQPPPLIPPSPSISVMPVSAAGGPMQTRIETSPQGPP